MVYFLILLCVISIILTFACFVFIKRAIEFDNAFESLEVDIVDSLSYLKDLLSKPVYANTPEIVELHNQLSLIRNKMLEHAKFLEEKRK